jgi:hypothetical protein
MLGFCDSATTEAHLSNYPSTVDLAVSSALPGRTTNVADTHALAHPCTSHIGTAKRLKKDF